MRAFFLLSNIQVAHFRLGLGPQGNDAQRRAIIDINRARARAEAHPRSYNGFFVRLRAIALLQVTAAAIYVGVQ